MTELAPASVPPGLRPDLSKVVFTITPEHQLVAHLVAGREDALARPKAMWMLRRAVERDGVAFVRSGDLLVSIGSGKTLPEADPAM